MRFPFASIARRIAVGSAAILFALHAFAGAEPSDVLVKGNGVSITRRELAVEMERLETEATNRGEAIVDEAKPRVQAESLDRMIFRRLMISEANDSDRKRAQFEANAFVAGAKAEAPSHEAYLRRLKRAGFTEETFAADKFAEVLAATVMDRHVRPGIRIDDGALRAFYEGSPERWEKPGSIRGIDLMMSSTDPATRLELEGAARDQKLKQLRSLRTRAVQGEDFTALVKQFSEDPRGRELGGVFTLPRVGAAPELEEALTKLKAGEISEVLTTPSGFHVVKVLEVVGTQKVPFAEAAPRLRAEMEEVEFKKQAPVFVEKLRSDAKLVFSPDAPRLPPR